MTVFYRLDWEVLRVKGCLSDTNSKTAVPRKPQDIILTIDAAVNTHTRASLCSGVSALHPRRGLTGSEGRAFPFFTNTAAAGPVNIRPFRQLGIPTGMPAPTLGPVFPCSKAQKWYLVFGPTFVSYTGELDIFSFFFLLPAPSSRWIF